MNDDVSAVLDWPAQIWRRKRVVDDQWHAGIARDRCNGLDVKHVQLRIADGLGVERLGVGLERPTKILGVGRIDEARFDAELGEGHGKLRKGSAVERSRSDDVI